MQYLEQIKEIVNSEIGRFTTVVNYALLQSNKNFEEYQLSFEKEFNPICIRAHPDGSIQISVGDSYESVSTIDASCCYLYIALMNAKREL